MCWNMKQYLSKTEIQIRALKRFNCFLILRLAFIVTAPQQLEVLIVDMHYV